MDEGRALGPSLSTSDGDLIKLPHLPVLTPVYQKLLEDISYLSNSVSLLTWIASTQNSSRAFLLGCSWVNVDNATTGGRIVVSLHLHLVSLAHRIPAGSYSLSDRAVLLSTLFLISCLWLGL